MSTNYQMWLNYNNDKKKFRFPVLPETVKVTLKGKQTSIDIDKLGEIFHKGRRDAMTISFSSFFPAVYDSSCSVPKSAFKKSKDCYARIKKLLYSLEPAHFVFTGGPMSINKYVIISSFVHSEEGGDIGTIHYTLELKEFRKVAVKKVKKTKKGKIKVSTSKKRVNNSTAKKGKYTVKNGDCMYNIAKKYYGDGTKYMKIVDANRKVLDADAKKHGYSSCNNGNILFSGITLVIP